MTFPSFADALLIRGLSACGLHEPDVVDPAAELPAPQRHATRLANLEAGPRAGDSANPSAWHALLKTH